MGHALHHALETSAEYDLDLTVTAGRWPDGLAGHLYLIGPAQPTEVNFMFAGPGILTHVDLGARHWRTSRVRTPDLALFAALRQALPAADFAALTLGARPALTNVAPHLFGDRLLLTGISQRPVEVDPATGDFHSFLGGVEEYPEVAAHPLFAGVRTAAHPVEDLDEGCMWWCNTRLHPQGTSSTDVEGTLWVARWDGAGPVQTWCVPGAHLMQGVHEVTVTEDYVIVTEIGFQQEPGSVAGRNRTKPHLPFTDIYLVAKRDLTATRRGRTVPVTHARVPYESFHHFAAYRQDGDDVTMYIAHSNGWDLNYSLAATDRVWRSGAALAPGLHGFISAPVDASPVGRYVIDGRTGEVRDSRLFLDPQRHWATLLYTRDLRRGALERGRYLWQAYWGCDPEMLVARIVDLYAAHPWRVVPVDRLPTREIPSSLVCLDAEAMTEQSAWSFPAGTVGESPVYVPDPAGGAGWVVLAVHHADRSELQVFDALALAAGPVAIAGAPGLKLSVQFHSVYSPTLRPRPGDYRRSFADDLDPSWKDLPVPTRTVIAQVLEQFA
ncbi:carotenoid oxygenase family protein [Frankia sp. AiPs1]|uniref:carotenoid oxygenase family protein n=1 Tax=Frankia sp. AiPs1 TaxID=573493 RepID=UPI0020444CFD|nr:carotenoid oxygenase family protein [Frankia sp. AiPs1]MCM3921471.1 carotenoid oxygenase family protein [Frankia sp. AiPs1]